MAGYSGNLVRTYATANDVKTPYPDKRHTGTSGHDSDGTDQYPDAHQVPGDQGQDFNGSDFPTDQVVGGGIILATPEFDHDSNATLYPIYTDDQVQQAQAAHDADDTRGWIGSKYEAPAIQAAGEVYGEDILTGFSPLVSPNTEGSPALLRGINSYAMNNPEREGYTQGVRPGIQRMIFNQRERLNHRGRVYDLQPLAQRDTLVPVNAPVLADPPMYGPVLPGWLPAAMGRRETQPAFWRSPGSVDDSMLASTAGNDSAVIGGDL